MGAADAAHAIRPARAADLAAVVAVEARAGEMFRAVGMAAVADGELPTAEQLLPAVHAGRLFVAIADGGAVSGSALAGWVDGGAHLEQVSVDPAFARRGIGRALIAAAEHWGRGQGSPSMTLTTYVDVPWNGPYYRRLGWHDVPAVDLGPELASIRAREAALGLDAWQRTAMAKEL